MSFDAHRSPARVSVAEAARLPRWLLWLLLVVYGVAGLPGHDPWYQDDAATFGVMWTMAQGGASDWLLPNVFGAPIPEDGPLSFWAGAVFIRLLGPLLGDAVAARVTCLFWFAVCTSALWYATYGLARRGEAQPVAFAFGGEANARDYGRMLADISVLLFLGTIGIATRLHQTVPETAAVAMLALILLGLAIALERPGLGACVTGLALGGLALARGVGPALFALPAIVAAGLIALRDRARWQVPLVATLVAAACFAVWPGMAILLAPERAADFFGAWRNWTLESIGFPGAAELGRIGRNFPWYAWPLWPLALWTAYAWRHALRAPHIALAGLLSLAMLASLLFSSSPSETMLILTVPSMVPLAAFGATTLRRAAENALDWFAIALFSLLAFGAWAYFVAMQTGVPPKMAASVARLIPGFKEPASVLGTMVAVTASLAWLALIVWRVRERPPMLWRGPMLGAAGLTTLWAVINLLFMPALNYNRSYARLASQVAAEIERSGGSPCVLAHRLQPAHRALFALLGGLRFVAPEQEAPCQVALHRDTRNSSLDDEPPPGPWRQIWDGVSPTRQDETFRLYRRGPG
ncbi:MAG TPA: glycosyltransferase family 39 protein [Burkholderiaceae bacterium]|nr:glycosyltransferase family 39 protein [Burkholderiaceae bacterium]